MFLSGLKYNTNKKNTEINFMNSHMKIINMHLKMFNVTKLTMMLQLYTHSNSFVQKTDRAVRRLR